LADHRKTFQEFLQNAREIAHTKTRWSGTRIDAGTAEVAMKVSASRHQSDGSETRSGRIQAFLGASLLTTVLLLPHSRAFPVGGGIVLAGVIQWCWSRRRH
jgi:hypothetical protein